MAKFIKFKSTYNALTTQGEGTKLINIDNIIHITVWPNKTNKRIKTIKSRLKLIDGEILDVKETIGEIVKMITEVESNKPSP